MTTALDTVFSTLVPSLLTRFGTDLTITKRTGTVSPSTRDYTSGSNTSMTLKASPPTVVRKAGEQGLAQIGDLETIVKGEPTFAIELDQVAAIGSVSYRIVQVDKLRSGDAVAAHRLTLRAT